MLSVFTFLSAELAKLVKPTPAKSESKPAKAEASVASPAATPLPRQQEENQDGFNAEIVSFVRDIIEQALSEVLQLILYEIINSIYVAA